MTKKAEKFGLTPKIDVTEQNKVEQCEPFFTLISRNGVTQIAVGNYIVSKLQFASTDEAKEYIQSKPWELLVNATCAIYDISKSNLK